MIDILSMVFVAGIIGAIGVFAWSRSFETPALIIAVMCIIVVVIVVLKPSIVSDQPRYISADEKRAATMFKQNCKQVGFVQANNSTDLGLGVSTNGKPVVGTIFSSNEDSYVYRCDEGIQYTLTYDIEKYRKYYQ
ncbi:MULTISPECIES: hypothetical protein [Acinetobacter]|uniref:hypothetical protein n=1 Tax=Acinetobacter TaxID=469 RepID=UPI0007EA76E4|nr:MULTISPECIES: hypothetical protein [Acinetobacter]EKT9248007.1 hypothetical protein [Acinetobacter baumannii]EKV8039602.1 hypothetical protein [Acinetobacter baumannii]MBE2308756.1 hypothetical protein [Acinetobacter baumannii]MBE2623498.1 hypothetical protein [Acinetobacter baumannii]MBE2664472.1 hypothetical protein [Acinetobacter baumannii]